MRSYRVSSLTIRAGRGILVAKPLNYETPRARGNRDMNKTLFHLHAEVCKTLANAKRLEILNLLTGGELTVSVIVKQMRVSKANVSQHLAVMRRAGIVDARREGANVYYRVSNSKVTKACELMREVLMEHHSRTEKILKQQR